MSTTKSQAALRKRYREHMTRIGDNWVASDCVAQYKLDVKELAEKTRKYAEPGEYHALMENRISAKALTTRTLEGES